MISDGSEGSDSSFLRSSATCVSTVRLMIVDIQGRLVDDLVRSVQGPGEYAVRWDGRDAAGRAAASGIYYYRLTTATWNEARAMVLLR